MPRAAVIETLGEPFRNEPKHLLYRVGGKFVNVHLKDESVDDLVVQRRDLAAEFVDAPELPAPKPITGEISLFVDGLSLPATRPDVTAALGTPQESLPDVDLYTERGRFVIFNYTGDDLTTISIAHVPTEE